MQTPTAAQSDGLCSNASSPDGTRIENAEDQAPCPTDQKTQRANKVIAAYLMENVVEFQELTRVRNEGWNKPEGDSYFKKQAHDADNADKGVAWRFYNMMKEIGEELNRSTNALRITRDGDRKPSILDMCMAPGGFLAKARSVNQGSSALAFSLPVSQGGHKVFLPINKDVEVRFLDITMLAADMGVTDIPPEHPDAGNFLVQKQFQPGQVFDLVFCDGQVLRMHDRPSYREKREAGRLTNTQLALGLEHARQGGSMIVLLHRIETWTNVSLLYTFSKFSSVKVFKHRKYHAKRSSFYMVASDIQSQHPDAIRAVNKWKEMWRVATFGTDEEIKKIFQEGESDVEGLIEEFGSELVGLGGEIWSIQARALAKAPFMRARP